MTVIGTNIAALRAQNGSRLAESSLSQAMERLSTGSKINNASDDAAGLAISTRMTSQIQGYQVATQNANDGIAMTETADGALGEVTNMLQRVRELAVQSANGTLSDDDRQSLQTETDQLMGEINNISQTSNYNGLKLLDGSVKNLKLQTGVDAGDTVSISMVNVSTKALGLTAGGSVGQLTTGRVGGGDPSSTPDLSNLSGSDITLNGKNAFSTSTTFTNLSTAKDLADAINANTVNTGVTAAVDNVVKGGAFASGGVASGGDFQINGDTVSGATASEMVDNINRNVKGVTATLSENGTISLEDSTGANISITGTDASKAGFTTGTYAGQLTLSTADGSPVKVAKGSTGDASDFAALGINAADANGSPTGTQVSTDALGTDDDLTINGTQIGKSTDSSAASKAAAINAVSSQTGVTASASTVATVKLDSAKLASGNTLSINGVTVTLADTDTNGKISMNDVVKNINDQGISGITASADADGNLVLTSEAGSDITLKDGSGGSAGMVLGATGADGAAGTGSISAGLSVHGEISLSSSDGGTIKVEGSAASLTKVGLTEQNAGVDAGTGTLKINTQDAATAALTAIDKALDQISNSRGNLGAIENRLNSSVNNLSTASTNLTAARSDITDADFSSETTNLAKSQILSQAATAMLAQANQSQQNVLSLLK